MPNWEVFDINQVKVGDMTQDEVDTRLFDSSSLDGLSYFFYDTIEKRRCQHSSIAIRRR